MRQKKNRELERLLAQGRLSGADYDRVFAEVRQHTQSDASQDNKIKHWGWRLIPAITAIAVIAIVGLWVFWSGNPTDDNEEKLRVKGSDTAIVVEHACLSPGDNGSIRTDGCRAGDRLLFRVDGLSQRLWMAAWAEHPTAGRLWWFPSVDGWMPQLQNRDGPQMVERTIKLKTTGTITVRVQFFDHPVDKDGLSQDNALYEYRFSMEIQP